MNRRRGLATIALATAIVCAGCSQNDHDDHDHLDHLDATSSMVITPPSLTYPPSLDVDASDPDSVTLGAVRTMYRWRFATDDDPRDAVRRAEPLLNAALATQLTAIPPEPFINYRLWDDWKRAGARTDVTATISAERHPDDTPTQQQRKVATRITVTDRTGKQLHQWEFAVLAVIQKQAGQWLLAQFQPLGA